MIFVNLYRHDVHIVSEARNNITSQLWYCVDVCIYVALRLYK